MYTEALYFRFYPVEMGKKKKSGNKLGKMTEEERILYLEQQRLAEEELKKKKEDVLMQFLKVTHCPCLNQSLVGINNSNINDFSCANILEDQAQWCD